MKIDQTKATELQMRSAESATTKRTTAMTMSKSVAEKIMDWVVWGDKGEIKQ